MASTGCTLSPIWQKAVVAGTFWGALEIVLGSILHNFMLPTLAGTLLSLAGVMIMTAVSARGVQRGLFWRAALVCAMLKSVSPSAVVVMPMLGIMLEGAFMELGVLLLGANLWGAMLGGGLAVLTVPVFKIARMLMMYGLSIHDLYLSLFRLSADGATPTYWPLAGVGLGYLLLGFLAVVLGYAVGRNIERTDWSIGNAHDVSQSASPGGLPLSVVYLLAHLAALVLFLAFAARMPTYASLIVASVYIALTLLFYPRARFPFRRPSFTLPIILFSFAIPLISVGATANFAWVESGARIAARAFWVVVAFAAIGTELGRPSIRGVFAGGFFQPAYMATSLAFSSLPEYMGRIRGFTLWGGNPIGRIRNLVSDTLRPANRLGTAYPIVLVVGERGGGKTAFVQSIAKALAVRGVRFTGFYALGQGNAALRTGYKLVLLPEQRAVPLSVRVAECGVPKKSFRFSADALREGETRLLQAEEGIPVLVDEIGQLELEGEGWADAFSTLTGRQKNPVVAAVRRANLARVVQRWGIGHHRVVDVATAKVEDILDMLKISQ